MCALCPLTKARGCHVLVNNSSSFPCESGSLAEAGARLVARSRRRCLCAPQCWHPVCACFSLRLLQGSGTRVRASCLHSKCTVCWAISAGPETFPLWKILGIFMDYVNAVTLLNLFIISTKVPFPISLWEGKDDDFGVINLYKTSFLHASKKWGEICGCISSQLTGLLIFANYWSTHKHHSAVLCHYWESFEDCT